MTLNEAILEYKDYMHQREKSLKTIEGYMQDLNYFRKWLEKEWNGPVYMEDLSFNDVGSFLRYLKEEKNYKAASRKRMSSALKMFFRFAWKRKFCSEDIASEIEDVKCIPKEREYMTEEEALEFISNIRHKVVKVLAYTLFYTGMRLSEALSLTDADVDMKNCWINIRMGKGGKSRKVPICSKLKTILADYMQWKAEGTRFFATSKTGALSKARVQSAIRETREKTGTKKNITAHVFRHSFASELVKRDVNIVSISKLLGHSNLKTTSIYTHASDEQLKEAIKVL